MPFRIRAGSPHEPQATALLESSQRLMQDLFTAEENYYLSVEVLCAESVVFLVAEEDERILGCVAMRRMDGYGEIKSLFTLPEARGRGIAAGLVNRLEEIARESGYPLLRLETGDLLHEAHRLYARQGFDLCEPFGDYADTSASIFMEKQLA
ncbi:putative acetyltransferase [Primorskyibacter flagellatus]|uniref:Putative acetyltransferase n=2 Tax=Primorskyibacter flagellatus TaxID=1387277 RepID=A0A1W1ZS62_9RHOB|nr:putative acetyltransferase [Primorskyibacter flagellatus]